MFSHELHPHRKTLPRQVEVLVVGAGTTGSKTVVGLKNIHPLLKALGYPGLHVTLTDGDTVSAISSGQSFYPSAAGLSKAVVLINRLNLSCGLTLEAAEQHATVESVRVARPDIVISCVNSCKARAESAEGVVGRGVIYALDTGNHTTTGQVVLGCSLGHYNLADESSFKRRTSCSQSSVMPVSPRTTYELFDPRGARKTRSFAQRPRCKLPFEPFVAALALKPPRGVYLTVQQQRPAPTYRPNRMAALATAGPERATVGTRTGFNRRHHLAK
jgi:PRTRC genetic system ThiF family protein